MDAEGRPLVNRARWVAAVTAGVFAVGGVLAGGADEDPAPPAAVKPDCVVEADLTLDAVTQDEAGDARWVRFCPMADEGAAQRVRHPQGVITDQLAGSMAQSLWQTQVDRPECLPGEVRAAGPVGKFRMQVGLADGRVADLVGDTGCSTRDAGLFSQLETTLLMDAAARVEPAVAAHRVRCPQRLTTMRTNTDGASAPELVTPPVEHPWQSTAPLLPMPATSAHVCAYTGRGTGLRNAGHWRLNAAQAETLRASATLEVDRGAQADCQIDPTRASYVVVLADATGTARTLVIDGPRCGTIAAAIGTPPAEVELGLATARLVRAVERSGR